MKLSKDFRTALRLFANTVGGGGLFDETDTMSYLPYLTDGCSGSVLETIFAIWSNVIELDENGRTLNDGDAEERAAQYMRLYCYPNYVVNPPFEQWELTLHLEPGVKDDTTLL